MSSPLRIDGSGCGGPLPAQADDAQTRRVLWMVVGLSLVMATVGMAAGRVAGSQALQADALDFLRNGLTVTFSLLAFGSGLRGRSQAALAKGALLSLAGLWVLGDTLARIFVFGVPRADTMVAFALVALAANLSIMLLVMPGRGSNPALRQTWLVARTDTIGNGLVIVAALGVWVFSTDWLDLIVAVNLAVIFLLSALQILRQAYVELRTGEDQGALASNGQFPDTDVPAARW